MNTAAKIGMMIAISALTFSGMTAVTTYNQHRAQQQSK
jgi:NO-binding membrane sensor protein with MHYT domain